MGKQFTLGKNERLKSRKAIEQLFNEGKKIMAAPLRVLYYVVTPTVSPGVLFGTGVSVKNFKRAVDRNRVKRVIREAYRLQKNVLQEKVKAGNIQLNVFFIYTGKELPQYIDIYNKTATILKKLQKIIES